MSSAIRCPSPRNGASSSCGWRRQLSDVKLHYEYVEETVSDSRQWVLFRRRVMKGTKS